MSHPLVKKLLTASELKRYAKIEPAAPVENQLLGWARSQSPEVELLLQLTSDPQAGMEWGDGDVLELYSSRSALLKGDFTKVSSYCGD